MNAQMTSDLDIDALLMAVWRRKPKQEVMVHSDQGSQGGFNRSSQNLDRGVYGHTRGMDAEIDGPGAIRSPGAPSFRNEIERLFWVQIATGITSKKAVDAVGGSTAIGTRWFRHRGGMPLFMSNHISGRYLSFAKREEIGLLRAQSVGVHEIACRLGRSPSTIHGSCHEMLLPVAVGLNIERQ